MDIHLFKQSPSGQIVQTPNNYHALVPNPLPPNQLPFDMALITLMADAERALGELAGLGHLIPNPDFLIIPYTRLEAVTSSRIEGTQASLSELFYYEAAPEKPKASDDLAEVLSYLSALNYGVERLKTLPLSLRLVRELHERLTSNTRGGTPDLTPGEFRRSQNWIGPSGCNLNNATYVPPPPDELMGCLGTWELFLHERNAVPLLIQCALMHYQFEAIHPFLDGNGRVGRLLITLFLCEREALPYPLLYLSAYFEQHRSEYYERLLAVSSRGDWTGWLEFFMRGVLTQSKHATESAKRIIRQREDYRRILQENRASANLLRVVDFIFTNPYLNIRQVANELHISFNTAHAAVMTLEEADILQEITGQQRNRVYAARQLLNLLIENEPIYTPKNDS